VSNHVLAALAIPNSEPIVEKCTKIANGCVRVTSVARRVPHQRQVRDGIRPLESLVAGFDGGGDRLVARFETSLKCFGSELLRLAKVSERRRVQQSR
jgi:hypothetical protein